MAVVETDAEVQGEFVVGLASLPDFRGAAPEFVEVFVGVFPGGPGSLLGRESEWLLCSLVAADPGDAGVANPEVDVGETGSVDFVAGDEFRGLVAMRANRCLAHGAVGYWTGWNPSRSKGSVS